MTPDYSVVITVRNRQRHLDRCLQGVLGQRGPSFEVVVIDYGSVPPVLLPGDARIRLHRIEPLSDEWNGSIALNAGVAQSASEKLLFLNCDCVIAPDLLQTADDILNSNEFGEGLQVYWQRFDVTRRGQQLLELLGFIGRSGPSRLLFHRRLPPVLKRLRLGKWQGLVNYGDFLAVERSAIIKIGGFDERMAGWGRMDVDLMKRLELQGYDVYWGRSFKMVHQFHPPQASKLESDRRNTRLSEDDIAAGIIVRNEGPATFEKYQ